ncbi:uncharacterized protein LOC123308104 isoform X3 [Coccinella septempunctata]|uniref:uncharacterized protein LOC123308104 isoform X3 n=1 Tax=Coccinella septempunctata TaxID=41139 RepID=UPI001D0681EA|nr:uncharacterized protein LOC123308104 isoform X3 [Coccinella septempunctata]
MGQHYRCRLLYHLLSRCLLGLPHPYRLYHHLGQSPIRSKCCTLSQCHLAEYCDLELSHLLMLVARSGIPGYNEGIAEYYVDQVARNWWRDEQSTEAIIWDTDIFFDGGTDLND